MNCDNVALAVHARSGLSEIMPAPSLKLVKSDGGDAAHVPRTIGRYVLSGELGRGAMGMVYRAQDPVIERPVALKMLNIEFGGGPRADIMRARFMREAKAAGRLSHPNIVTIYDVGEDAGGPYIAMEYLPGLTLRESLDSGVVMPVRKILDVGLFVVRGLDYAHKHGVVHRDIKPANIMLARSGMVKIMDFGIAGVPDTSRTLFDGVIGSPSYMSPEQIAGKRPDARTDLFALGTMLYEMLAGRNPFEGASIPETMHRVLSETPPPPSILNPDVPPELDGVVLKAIEKKADDRYQSAKELGRALLAIRRALRSGQSAPVHMGSEAGEHEHEQDHEHEQELVESANVSEAAGPVAPPARSRRRDASRRHGSERKRKPVGAPLPARWLLLAVPLLALAVGGGVYLAADTPLQVPERPVDRVAAAPVILQPAAAPTQRAGTAQEEAQTPPAALSGQGAPIAPDPAGAEAGSTLPLPEVRIATRLPPEAEAAVPAEEAPAALEAARAAGAEPATLAAAPAEPSPADTAQQAATPPAARPADSAQAPARAETAQRPPAEAGTPATVSLAILPWGEVFVNGRSRGVTPPLGQLELPPGRYRIEVRNGGFRPHVRNLALEAGGSYRINHRFRE